MSKSLGNVVSPDEMVERYGGDSTRMYASFATAPDRELDWQDEGVAGVYRFLSKVYRFVSRNCASRREGETLQATSLQSNGLKPEARAIQRKLHQTIKRVTDDFQGRWHFNTSIAAIMELVNELYSIDDRVGRTFLSDNNGRATQRTSSDRNVRATHDEVALTPLAAPLL